MAPVYPSPPNLAPYLHMLLPRNSSRAASTSAGAGDWRAHASNEDLVLESWSEGYMVGSLIIMACITIANMRRQVLLHKLILTEQLMAMCHGTFCFMDFKGYGWYLSSTATLLYLSWIVHNVVAWMKIRPFFTGVRTMFKTKTGIWVRNVYLSTLACTVPAIIFEIYNNFRFFNNINDLYERVRPYEPLMRDPWWVFTCLTLFHVIRKCYGTGVVELIKRSPRFGILLMAIILSMTFTGLDISASIHNFIGSTDGINPWWKLSLVFKCLTDTIMLDDFKTELKRLGIKRIRKEEQKRHSFALVLDDKDDEEDDDGRQLEYADALNTNPARFHGNVLDRRATADTTDSPSRRLRHDSVDMNGSAEKRGGSKSSAGKGGMKIKHLPGLKRFEGIKAGKKDKKAEDRDVEKQSPPTATPPPTAKKEHDDSSDPSSSTERVNHMRRSLGVIDFQTRPEGF